MFQSTERDSNHRDVILWVCVWALRPPPERGQFGVGLGLALQSPCVAVHSRRWSKVKVKVPHCKMFLWGSGERQTLQPLGPICWFNSQSSQVGWKGLIFRVSGMTKPWIWTHDFGVSEWTLLVAVLGRRHRSFCRFSHKVSGLHCSTESALGIWGLWPLLKAFLFLYHQNRSLVLLH